MNARWLKQNLAVIVFVAAFVIVLALIIFLEHKSTVRKDSIVEQLSQQQAELDRLRTLNPTPAPENIDALRRDREEVQKLYQELQKRAMREPVEVPDLQRDIDFSQLMRDTVSRLSSEAGRNGVKLVDNFAFGFSRYDTDFPCRHPTAKPEDCRKLLALLAKQLRVIDKLSSALIQSKVAEITRIRRTEVESGTASADALPVPIGSDPKTLYKTYPFELEFSCDTEALRAFLNGLTQSDWFFAVRFVKVESAGAASTPTERGVEGERPGETTRISEERVLNVTVRVDLVEFIEPPATKT